jgi:hypothetical protein
MESQKKIKEDMLIKEGKLIVKKDKQVRKLEILEAEVLKRLKDTHLKQQEAILEIQKIISKKELSSDLLMHQDSILQQNSSVSF